MQTMNGLSSIPTQSNEAVAEVLLSKWLEDKKLMIIKTELVSSGFFFLCEESPIFKFN